MEDCSGRCVWGRLAEKVEIIEFAWEAILGVGTKFLSMVVVLTFKPENSRTARL